jgi:ABC-type oligopeptide transport system substrate-binding subunit
LEFTIFYVIEENETFLTLFVDTCKKTGVKVNLSRMSWATMIKKMDEYKYDALVVGWTGTNFDDPEQLWHSKHITEIGGSNLPGYNNPKVDRMIDSLPPVFDLQQRIKTIKAIDRILYDDTPYILFWGRDYSWLFYKNIFGHPKTVFQKYSGGIIKYWWFDPAKAKRYKDAVRNNTALPQEPEKVYYDQSIK